MGGRATENRAGNRPSPARRAPPCSETANAGDREATELESGAWLAERLKQLGARLSEAWRPRSGGVDADPATFASLSGGDGRRRGGGGVGALEAWRLASTPKRREAAPGRAGARAGDHGGETASATKSTRTGKRRGADETPRAETAHRSAALKATALRDRPDASDVKAPPRGAAAEAKAPASRSTARRGGAAAPAKRLRRRLGGAIHGPESRTADVEGVSIHGAEFRGADAPSPEAAAAAGAEGRPELALILVHGAGLDHRDWTFDFARKLSERMGRRAWIFAIDRPGFGRSERPKGPAIALPGAQARVLRKAVESWGVRRAIVAGHSWGGAVAAAWTLSASQTDAERPPSEMTVTGLASFAGALLPWSLTEAIRHGRRIRDAARIAMRAGGFGADGLGEAARQAIAESFSPNPVPDGYLQHVATRLSAIDGPTASTMADISSINGALALSAPKLAEIAAPVELVYGTDDEILSIEEQGVRANALLPSARLTRLEGVGHMVHHSAPEKCLAALDRLVAASS